MIDSNYYMDLCVDSQQNYERYKKDAEENVVRTEFVEEKRYDLSPYWFERKTQQRGKVTNEDTGIYYGFDQDNKLRVTACDDLIDGYGYTSYGEDHIITRLYVNGILDSIKVFTGQQGKFERCVEYIVRHGLELEKSWYDVEEYIYEDDRLIQVHNPKYVGKELYKHLENTYLDYDENGELHQVFNGVQQLVYNNMTNQAALALRETLKAEVIRETENIFKATAEEINGEQVCFFSIYLDGDPLDNPLDPIYQPGFERVRVVQLEQNENQYFLWSAGEHPMYYQTGIKNEELRTKLHMLYVHWSLREDCYTERMKFWQEVAYSLNESDWSEYLPVTDDFVIFVDWEEVDFAQGEHLQGIPEHKQEILRAKGLILS
ncbi:hypothetical protein [Paenibacillus durus]|uniref:Uncharacterized protein n=1 Tax=Paenibacillus durus ATCC 35681 TaxID=1333534 RepID=A0A0F7FAU9_PAEDU|nr:hypothetical protein [Paenibacillus durus]AKG35297.1 hypothetical protein VK70_12525 [Paenibacillus durus ATCC 35681]